MKTDVDVSEPIALWLKGFAHVWRLRNHFIKKHISYNDLLLQWLALLIKLRTTNEQQSIGDHDSEL